MSDRTSQYGSACRKRRRGGERLAKLDNSERSISQGHNGLRGDQYGICVALKEEPLQIPIMVRRRHDDETSAGAINADYMTATRKTVFS